MQRGYCCLLPAVGSASLLRGGDVGNNDGDVVAKKEHIVRASKVASRQVGGGSRDGGAFSGSKATDKEKPRFDVFRGAIPWIRALFLINWSFCSA